MNKFGIALFATATMAQPMYAQERMHKPGMVHTPGMAPAAPAVLPTQGGQGAFAAISEIIRLLEADSTTDWSRVNLERLRLHLIDMDLVTLRSTVTSTNVAGGAQFTVTAPNASDTKAIAHIRALGFIGLMASGDHHPAHHIMLARGDAMADHGH